MDRLSRGYVYVLIVLFLMSIILNKGDAVLWLNGHHTPFLDSLFRFATNLGDGIIFIPIVLVMLFIRFEYAIMCVVLSAGHGILVSIFKRLLFPSLERPRNYLSHESLYFVPGVDIHSSHTFPSGHTTTAFCAALFLGMVSKNKTTGYVTLMLALLVGCSRIYLLQHFLIDVAAGAVIGFSTTYMVWYGFKAWHKPAWMNSRLSLKIVASPSKQSHTPQEEKVI